MPGKKLFRVIILILVFFGIFGVPALFDGRGKEIAYICVFVLLVIVIVISFARRRSDIGKH